MFTPDRKGTLARLFPAGPWAAVSLFAISIVLTGCAAPTAAPAPSQPSDDGDMDLRDETIVREIEEADIVKFDDGYFYLANRWTGLRIIDARTIERPLLAGRVPMQGRAVELFVDDERAFILSSADFFYCAGQPVGFEDDPAAPALTTPDYTGSRITVVDVSDKQAPAVVAEFDLDGFVSATRRVGDVIYAAGSFPYGYVLPDDGDMGTNGDVGTNGDASTNGIDGITKTAQVIRSLPRAFVVSINIADPDDPYLVDREIFSGDSFEISVSTQNAMFVAGVDLTLTDTTLVTYVDISDLEGAIQLRDQFRVPGLIKNRYFMDEYDGVFRVVTEEFPRTWPIVWTVALYSYDVGDPDHVTRLSRLPIISNESLRAVRFDGPRAYAVTFVQVDPLFVLDLSDAASPVVAGELEVPGYSTHLVPLGDRLVGVGFADAWASRPAVSLYDVSDPARPRQLSRIQLAQGGDHVSSEATFDEKALKVLEGEGLILMPFSYHDHDEKLDFVDSLQIIDLLPDSLRERSHIDHRGLVRRAGVVDERLWVLSDEAFLVSDIDDRDAPREISAIDIITEQELLDLGLTTCVDSARHRVEWFDEPWLDEPWFGDDVWFMPGIFCGAGVPAAAMLTALGLVGFRRASRRR